MTSMSKKIKQLWLIRHAHALAAVEGQSDDLRALMPRGHEQAHLLGRWLSDQPLEKALLLVSSATRSQETGAELQACFSEALPQETEQVIYAAQTAEDILAMLRKVSEHYDQVLLVGHNPLLKELLAKLLGLPFGGPFHKAAVAQLDTQVYSWKDLQSAVFKQYWLPQKMAERWQFQAHLGLSEILSRMGSVFKTTEDYDTLRGLGDELGAKLTQIDVNGEKIDQHL